MTEEQEPCGMLLVGVLLGVPAGAVLVLGDSNFLMGIGACLFIAGACWLVFAGINWAVVTLGKTLSS